MNTLNYKERICDANALYKGYLASIKNTEWKEASQSYKIFYLPNLFDLQDDLLNQTLTNGRVNEFFQNERGRVRAISSIPVKDKIVRHVLCDDVFMPLIKRKIIYDNGASIKGRGLGFQRKRFEVHLKEYYKLYGNEGYILFGDFTKFYDNVVHVIAKKQFLELVENDEFIKWLLDLIFDGFVIDVSFLSDEEYKYCYDNIFDKNFYRKYIPKEKLTGQKLMYKSINIGDQLSQLIGIYYPNKIDTYVKYVRSQKFYGRYMDDWYIMSPDKEELKDILKEIRKIAKELGIFINNKKTRIVKINKTFKFLQVKYTLLDDGKIVKRINPRRLRNFRVKLKKMAKKDISYNDIEEMFRSWMGSFYKLMSKDQRKDIFELYETLFNKKIEVVNKKLKITNKVI